MLSEQIQFYPVNKKPGEANMPFWQRAIITLVAMIVVSIVFGYVWRSLLGFTLPDYVSGVVGGVTAVPVWEFLKRIRPK